MTPPRPARERLDFSLYLLAPGPEGVVEAIGGGVDIVQLRDKTAPDSVLLEKARALLDITRHRGVPFIVNDRPDVCTLVGASGVHLGQGDMPVAAARRVVGSSRAIGVSAHSLEQALRAEADGADYVAIGPVFATKSKGLPLEGIGLEVVAEVVARVRIPVVAIGGIDLDNIERVLATGAMRVAAMRGILGGGDPGREAAALRRCIQVASTGRGAINRAI